MEKHIHLTPFFPQPGPEGTHPAPVIYPPSRLTGEESDTRTNSESRPADAIHNRVYPPSPRYHPPAAVPAPPPPKSPSPTRAEGNPLLSSATENACVAKVDCMKI